MNAVVCKQIEKSYGTADTRVQALRGVSMEAKLGELLMLVGPSGCGKTTLLSIISGILRQDHGECWIQGVELSQLSSDARTEFRRAHIGFIFQSLQLVPSLTALENITIPLLLAGIDEKEAADRASVLLDRVGLSKRKDAYPKHMSGGEQQRVAICRGCIHTPPIIVCDEPTSALDHQTGMAVMSLFQEITHTYNCCLILVTHDARIFEFADRILRLDDGHIIEGGSESASGDSRKG